MDFETEEQQVEALKKWWKENASMIILGLVLGSSVLFGWRFYNDYQIRQAEEASNLYDTVIALAAANEQLDQQQTKVNTLLAEYADTPYASLAAMMLAKQQIIQGELVQAQQQLEWVINHSRQVELKHIATLRLARVLFAAEKYDQALVLLGEDHPESFSAMYEELKGDVYMARGELDQARVAYDKAILKSTGQAINWLQMKRDDLGSPKRAEPSA
ncbi:MAG: tetratricopeptide repeat protein [Gammaproteobacteria bacterium]|nr:tetratricopeptide repeat protein [Gammaproteobacteria bacterium]